VRYKNAIITDLPHDAMIMQMVFIVSWRTRFKILICDGHTFTRIVIIITRKNVYSLYIREV